ncbi:hypothetical protein BKH43_05555 [Helicobacter sp. 13S00401-1]|uniref:hypothetical protein n=1 Tax=Helicobacter sp. 13S00401-1 TaxID=1905758 RepID=UPI000BA6CD6C|nr:hypothetical protein [Helicobacter sp. 13S00401-1]PAF50201.1 hypothetical protein BKH43_05555 [Helicobacter sp. 13S00401-1]
MKLYLTILTCVVFLTGCTSLVLQPSQVSSYDNGIKIYQDSKPNSKIQLEVGQEKVGGFDTTPLVLYVTAESKNTPSIFDLSNLSFYMNGKPIYPLSYDELRWANLNLSDAAYDYGVYTKPARISTALTPSDIYFSAPFYAPFVPFGIYGFGFNYGFYNYAIARSTLQAQLDQNAINKANALIYQNYLRKSTLLKDSAKGGFVLIPYKRLKAGTLKVTLKVGSDTYDTSIKLLKPKDAKKMKQEDIKQDTKDAEKAKN